MYRLQKEKNINVLYNALIAVGVFLAVLQLAFAFYDMALSIVYYNKANVPSITFLVYQLLLLYIPLYLLIPNGKQPKGLVLKWVFYAIALCFILGNSWVIYFIADNSFADLFKADFATFYEYQRTNALMFNYTIWYCYEPISLIFSLIAAVLYFICGSTLDGGRRLFRICLSAALIMTFIIPVSYKIYFYGHLSLEGQFGLVQNVFLIASQGVTTVAMVALSLSSRLWSQTLWTVHGKRY